MKSSTVGSPVFAPGALKTPLPLCRNILIHGYCKYSDKGCMFNHDRSKSTPGPNSNVAVSMSNAAVLPNDADSPLPSGLSKKRFNVDTPSFTPLFSSGASTPKTTLSPKVAEAAPFVPGSIATTFSFNLDENDNPLQSALFSAERNSRSKPVITGSGPPRAFVPSSTGVLSSRRDQDKLIEEFNPFMTDMAYANSRIMAGEVYPLTYHLNAPLPLKPCTTNHDKSVREFFIASDLRQILHDQNTATLKYMSPSSSSLPEYVLAYHSLVPLDTKKSSNKIGFGYNTSLYKTMSNNDGKYYAMRRLEGYRLENEKVMSAIRKWKTINSPNVVNIHESFTTKQFSDNSLVFIYDYYPLAKTLHEKHLTSETPNVDEKILWGYIVQILTALATIHESGLAARVVDLNKIIITSQNRIRLNSCGILDVLDFCADNFCAELRTQDFIDMGMLILSLAFGSQVSKSDQSQVQLALNKISPNYTPELINLIGSLLNPSQNMDATYLLSQMTDKLIDSINSSEYCQESLETELSRELENGRLVRLVSKLGFIDQRLEYTDDPKWSETGEKFFLKMFRDYVFHQDDELGKPVLDLAHVIKCLNKLDAGVDEKILLTSDDEKISIIVSYWEAKSCIESTFKDLRRT
ncbi:hypothetical protein NADFUDRAFT_80926 [Nadsonia fulvescens var. elongata DSM 6958]|uniref:PAN2-PAN3 deadenylation complex subunit PAN3 n=1 Tax=Nadsonia fulvescens var. elongata DSM 6958 TaxID=857566 RepID=A0A1E3PQS4_9ASCO|nr:hypothetical protein NADFUDRAFT_80926 [Nadsonia fulvescens var. elongata DSM 6958]